MSRRPDPTARALARATPARPERAIQAAILALFRAHGLLAWGFQRERAGRRRASHIGFPGCPDVLGYLPGGRGLAVEIKRPGAPLRPAQAQALDVLGRHGVATGVLHSVDEAARWLAAVTAPPGPVCPTPLAPGPWP